VRKFSVFRFKCSANQKALGPARGRGDRSAVGFRFKVSAIENTLSVFRIPFSAVKGKTGTSLQFSGLSVQQARDDIRFRIAD
jgi:hypothetical protein